MSNTTSPFSKTNQHALKRQAILSEAAGLFNRQGTRTTTLVDIADKLNLTKTSLYYYVKTKNELVYLCYMNSCDYWESILNIGEMYDGNGREKLEHCIRGYFKSYQKTMLKQEPERSILSEVPTLKEKNRAEIIQRYKMIFNKFQALIEFGITDGSLEHCDPIASTLSIFGNLQWTVMWLTDVKPDHIPAAGEAFIDLYMNGLAVHSNMTCVAPPEFEPQTFGKSFDRTTQNLEKQEAFYKVGSSFFNKKGFKGTSLDEIAEALNVTKGAFYYHIKNKDDLLQHCFKRTLHYTKMMQDKADSAGDNGLAKIELSIHYLFHIQNSETGPLIRYNLLNSLNQTHKTQVVKETHQCEKRFGTFITLGIKDGSVRAIDAAVAKNLIAGAINACVELPALTGQSDRIDIDEMEKVSAQYFKSLLFGLASR